MLNETGGILVISGLFQFIVGYSISAHSFLISQTVSDLLFGCRYYCTTIALGNTFLLLSCLKQTKKSIFDPKTLILWF